jgi:methionyl aminopeptidase
MATIKTPQEIQIMREGGVISGLAIKEVLKNIKPGVTTFELDKIAERVIKEHHASPSFMTVDNYPFTTCININEGIVHGLPNKYVIKEGDLVSIDLGALYKEYHTDLSYTVEVGTNKEKKFLDTGKKALENAIFNCVTGATLGDIGYAIQREVEKQGYSVSRDLVGHGIGTELHESPLVPGYGKPGKGMVLKEGMVIAIEVIYQKGAYYIVLDRDGWTYKTADNSLSGLFEHTVAIVDGKPEVLTRW